MVAKKQFDVQGNCLNPDSPEKEQQRLQQEAAQ